MPSPPLRMGAGTDLAIFKRTLEEEKGGAREESCNCH